MYTRWAEKHGFKVEYLEETQGEEAGIKSATIQISGHNAYGWLKTEGGVHRLVRISPFDSNARRHTSFSSVAVFPVVDDSIKIDIKESDVRTDTMRSGGAGGQHVNKTESAVRLTHIPTGVAVVCQAGRSQHKNRAQAWDMLRARLYEIELKKREEQAAADQAAKTEIGWGHQIRSYVLQPYQMVKDLRTGVQTSDTSGVLDGDLDEFMAATWRSAPSAPRRARSRTWISAWQGSHSSVSDAWAMAWPAAISMPGFEVAVWNRSKAKAEDLIARGAHWATSPADAAVDADAVVTMVADDEASRAVWLGKDGAARPRRPARSRSNVRRCPITMRSISPANCAAAGWSISIVR